MATKTNKEAQKTIDLQQKLLTEAQEFRKQFFERLLRLVTSGFGLVSALAWNEVIKEVVKNYIKPVFGKTSGFISLVIYAILVTFLAVLVTYNLSRLAQRANRR
jgi:histone H3/H4